MKALLLTLLFAQAVQLVAMGSGPKKSSQVEMKNLSDGKADLVVKESLVPGNLFDPEDIASFRTCPIYKKITLINKAQENYLTCHRHKQTKAYGRDNGLAYLMLFLKDGDVDPNAEDLQGRTPLEFLYYHTSLYIPQEAVKKLASELVRHGADPKKTKLHNKPHHSKDFAIWCKMYLPRQSQ